MPLEHDLITTINDELLRIQAKEARAARHLIRATDWGKGNASLEDSTRGSTFHFFGAAAEILEGLRRLPTDGGAAAIVSEFS